MSPQLHLCIQQRLVEPAFLARPAQDLDLPASAADDVGRAIGVAGGVSSSSDDTGAGALTYCDGGGARMRRAGDFTASAGSSAIDGGDGDLETADGVDVVADETLLMEAPLIDGLRPTLTRPTASELLATLAVVFVRVSPFPPPRSVSLAMAVLFMAFFSSRSAFLPALSSTPGQAAGTFISHFVWQA